MDKKTESFMMELNRRAALWERMKADAERRVELNDINTPCAKIDLEVAERALERIAKKKEELDEKARVDYTDPIEMKALQKRVHIKAEAVVKRALAKDAQEENKC